MKSNKEIRTDDMFSFNIHAQVCLMFGGYSGKHGGNKEPYSRNKRTTYFTILKK